MTLAVNHVSSLLRRPAIVLAFLLWLSGCQKAPEGVQLSGPIFGTQWSLIYHGVDESVTEEKVKEALLESFSVVDDSMNHYLPSSTLSELNRLPAMEVMEVDWDFALVFNTALDIYYATDGAYDPSVSPLINLWGFGPEGVTKRPTDEEIAAVEPFVGLDEFAWDLSTRGFVKRDSKATLDFSSIAKGYAVDIAADSLDELGLEHFMLEVGGEIQVRGTSPRGDAWRLAVERPTPGSRGQIFTAIEVKDIGVATSGDYRNFFEDGGRRFSHLIDPRTGYPIEHDLVSATVVHPSTMIADAWATALMVVGTEEALRLADVYELAVFLISREDDQLVSSHNDAMTQWLMEPKVGGEAE
ncbi:MAG: FAD:protein FMN transferase [Pseudomonadota bacterium]|nr:FAD:protein FMN transferase [Pseudomonadota bacterium]MEC8267728.1 FAD:protein FMN transferase [Pseudomonadota bacterium]